MRRKKMITFLMMLAMFITTCCPTALKAEEKVAIQECSDIEDFKIEKQDSFYSIVFYCGDEKVELKCEFFTLQDAALLKGKIVGNVIESNKEILYIAFSKTLSPLDKINGELAEDEILFSIVFLSERDGKAVNVNVAFQKFMYPILEQLFSESLSINYENEIYGELLHSQLWMKFYIPENRAVTGEFVQIDTVSSEISTYGNDDNAVVLSFIKEANLKTPGQAHGIKYNINNEPIGFYIRDTFKLNDSCITLLALFDIMAEVAGSGSERNITFQVQRAYNYFVEMSSNGVMKVTEADANSTYLVTKDASIGLGLVGTSTQGYFDTCKVEASLGGSSSSVTEFLGDSVISLVGLKYPLVSTVSTVLDFFGSAMQALSDAVYDATYHQFKLFGTIDYTKCPKIVSTVYENQMYKKFSLVKMFVTIKRYSSSTSDQIHFQFRITTIGSQYQQNPTLNVNTTIEFKKSL